MMFPQSSRVGTVPQEAITKHSMTFSIAATIIVVTGTACPGIHSRPGLICIAQRVQSSIPSPARRLEQHRIHAKLSLSAAFFLARRRNLFQAGVKKKNKFRLHRGVTASLLRLLNPLPRTFTWREGRIHVEDYTVRVPGTRATRTLSQIYMPDSSLLYKLPCC